MARLHRAGGGGESSRVLSMKSSLHMFRGRTPKTQSQEQQGASPGRAEQKFRRELVLPENVGSLARGRRAAGLVRGGSPGGERRPPCPAPASAMRAARPGPAQRRRATALRLDLMGGLLRAAATTRRPLSACRVALRSGSTHGSLARFRGRDRTSPQAACRAEDGAPPCI